MEFHRSASFDHVHRHVAGYHAAYVLGPDGDNVQAVYRGPAVRSADCVIVRPDGSAPEELRP